MADPTANCPHRPGEAIIMSTTIWTETPAGHHHAVIGDRTLHVYPADHSTEPAHGNWIAEVLGTPTFDPDDLYHEEFWVTTTDTVTDAKTWAVHHASGPTAD